MNYTRGVTILRPYQFNNNNTEFKNSLIDGEMKILDTTLREGEQTPNVSFTYEEKIEFASMIDQFGVDMIEAGHPSVSPNVKKAVSTIARMGLDAEVIGHVRAVRSDIDLAIDCGVDRIAIFLASSDLHLAKKLRMSRERSLEIITREIEYVRDHGIKVRYTPEDATRTDIEFLGKLCSTAVDAGADRISIADTVGRAEPFGFGKLVNNLTNEIDAEFDVHCHNDLGLALANAHSAIQNGASCIHTTVNGLGERCGIVDLASLTVSVSVLYNKSLDQKYQLHLLPEISDFIQKASGEILGRNTPVVGSYAFTHKSGVHSDGVIKNPQTYEPYDPSIIGRFRSICVDKYTGKLAVTSLLSKYGVTINQEDLIPLIQAIKQLGDRKKIIHDIDIIETYETLMGDNNISVPKEIEVLINITLYSNIYTTSIVYQLNNFNNVTEIYEMAGDEDLTVKVEVPSINQLNEVVESIRSLGGIKSTNTRIILKKAIDRSIQVRSG